MEIIDISQELLSGSVFEGDTAPRLTAIKTVERDGFAVSDLTVCLHNGTHVDAPSHTFSGGKDVCAAELSVFGRVRRVYRRKRREKFLPSYAVQGRAARRRAGAKLADMGIKLAGTQQQSFDGKDTLAVHGIFARAGVYLLENLVLKNVDEGKYFLCALPLKAEGAEASPVRAVLVKYRRRCVL